MRFFGRRPAEEQLSLFKSKPVRRPGVPDHVPDRTPDDHKGLVGTQFHTLPMFLPADHIIEHFDKGDSLRLKDQGVNPATPREQWQGPSLRAYPESKSLRDVKREDSADEERRHGPRDLRNAPPISLGLGQSAGSRGTRGRPLVLDGHHRLAGFEQRSKTSEVPVKWHP